MKGDLSMGNGFTNVSVQTARTNQSPIGRGTTRTSVPPALRRGAGGETHLQKVPGNGFSRWAQPPGLPPRGCDELQLALSIKKLSANQIIFPNGG